MTPEDTAPVEWRPSHRRSEQTGKVLDHWHRDDSKHGVSMPEVYNFDGASSEPPPERGQAEALRRVFALLKDGRHHTMPARVAALEYVFRLNGNTLRDAACEAGCEVKTLCAFVRKFQRLLRGNP